MLELMAQSVGIYNTCQMVSIAILSQDAVGETQKCYQNSYKQQ